MWWSSSSPWCSHPSRLRVAGPQPVAALGGGGWAENQAAPSLSLCQSSMARHPNGAALSLPVILKRHPRAGDTGHSTGGKRCLLSYKLFFSVLLALLQEPQHGAGCVQLPSWAQHLGSISPGCACPSDRLCGYINKAALCYSSVCLLGIWNKINQRRLRFAITNRSCTKLLATSSFGAQECWELRVLGGCREIRCSSQVRKRLI